jgi:transposase
MRSSLPGHDPSALKGGFVPIEHPLRRVRAVVDASLGALHQWLYSAEAPPLRASMSPEQVLRAVLLQLLFSVRRDRQLVDQIWYSLLFRWFVGVRPDEPKWDLDAFAAWRQHLLTQDIVRETLLSGLREAYQAGLLTEGAHAARRSELRQFASDVTVGVGQPGVLPSARAKASKPPTTVRDAYDTSGGVVYAVRTRPR